MNKTTESMLAFFALGVTGFFLWRAWRDGKALAGSNGYNLGLAASASNNAATKQNALANLVPQADDFINSIYGSGGSGSSGGSGGFPTGGTVTAPQTGSSGNSIVVLSNGKVYGQAQDPGYSAGM
jgi:hypothetical protein